MPCVYRIMRKDEDGFPVVARSASALGIRVGTDIDVDENQNAIVNYKGMSVSPHWRDVKTIRIPKRLGGRGSNNTHCFRAGEGAFECSPFSDGLELYPDPPQDGKVRHGSLRPARTTALSEYEDDLAKTRMMWQVDET